MRQILAILLLCSTLISGAPSANGSEDTDKDHAGSGGHQYWTRKYLCLSKGDAIWGVVAVVAAAILLPTLINCFCGCCGFKSDGVSGGSYAAGYQSGVGNVPKGSCFSCLQSCTAKGGINICGWGGILSAICTAAGYWYWMHSCVGEGPEMYRFIKKHF